MDIKSLSELLKGTLDPSHRNEAEKKLTEIHKIIGFGPVLLQVMIDHVVYSCMVMTRRRSSCRGRWSCRSDKPPSSI